MRLITPLLLTCVISLLPFNLALADAITKPTTFSAGTPAKAAEVNANFDTVYDQVNKVGTQINIDTTNGRVGIGTATPGAKLEVNGTIRSTTGGIQFPDGTIQGTAVVNDCQGIPLPNGICLAGYGGNANFADSAAACASMNADICTDSQVTILGDPFFAALPRWTASFADNDSSAFSSHLLTSDDHAATTPYRYACCLGVTPVGMGGQTTTYNNVQTTYVHNAEDTRWYGASKICSALHSDLCSDSQTYLIRNAGALTVQSWTNSHSDNDGGAFTAALGTAIDNPAPSSNYGFACCASTLPSNVQCPVARTNGVCAVAVNDVADSTFLEAATACAAVDADICSISQSAVLRANSVISVDVWTNSHSDNDSLNASVGVGATMPDNPQMTDTYGYACCRK